jgi:plastocyanin
MGRSTLVAAGLVVLLGCGGGDNGTGPGDGGGGENLVHATRVTATTAITFSPQAVSIPAGDTIYYTFQSVQHNVTFDTPGMPGNPGNVPNTVDATVKRRFLTAGTFNYHCTIHSTMTGTVTVTQ